MPGTFFGPYSERDNDYANAGNANLGRFPLGHTLILPDGRIYKFSLNDGTIEVAGRLYQGALPVGDATNQTADVARAVGATVISATLGSTAAAIDEYSEGYVHTNDADGEGYNHRIRRAHAAGDGHAAADSSAVLTVNLEAGESVQVALTTASQVTFSHNPYHQILIHASPATGGLAGVSPGVAAANRFYWSQTNGPSAVLTQGTLIIGDFCVPSATVDGAVMPSAAFETDGPYVGIVQHVNADGEESLVNLKFG
jgi:predicted RNA-binding protein with TRAM domain